jgi:hypothetical protein
MEIGSKRANSNELTGNEMFSRKWEIGKAGKGMSFD